MAKNNNDFSAISIQNVTKIYNNKKSQTVALDNVSLEIPKGSIMSILGHNGAGKSTLVRIATGLANPTFGSVLVNGVGVAEHGPEIKSLIGFVTQDFCLDSFATVYDTLMLYSLYYGKTNNDAEIDKLLDMLDLADRKHSQNFTLSLGMKRRLMMAKALVHDPEIVILDEPTVGVDFDVRNKIISHIQELKNRGKTVVLITHHLDEVEKLSTHVAILQKGKLIYKNTKEELEKSFRVSEVLFYLQIENESQKTDFINKIKSKIPSATTNSDGDGFFLSVANSKEELTAAVETISSQGIKIAKITEKTTTLESAINSIANAAKMKQGNC